jgi:hypothetical protein
VAYFSEFKNIITRQLHSDGHGYAASLTGAVIFAFQFSEDVWKVLRNIRTPTTHIATGATSIPNTENGATCILMIHPPTMGLRIAPMRPTLAAQPMPVARMSGG